MIINFILDLFILFIGGIFSWLPQIATLPTIAGYDIDGALVTGMGDFYAFATAEWPLMYVMYGFGAIMGYLILKKVVKFFFGSHAPID